MCAETEARAAETSMLSSGDGHERSVEATRKFPASFCNDCGGDKPDIVPGASSCRDYWIGLCFDVCLCMFSFGAHDPGTCVSASFVAAR